jgi:hypothetical protein
VYRLPEEGISADMGGEDETEQLTSISTGILSGSATI